MNAAITNSRKFVPGILRAAAILLALSTAVVVRPARGQTPLPCGVPAAKTLAPGAVDTYRFTAPPGAKVLIQGVAVSPATFHGLRMRVTNASGAEIDDTCSGITQFNGGPGEFALQVSQCDGAGGGLYTVTMNVVSDGAGNCARPLSCGGTPDGTGFAIPGEVDSFAISM
ncbi:MAG: hypothetical protein ABI629_25715, partial [bacterium]